LRKQGVPLATSVHLCGATGLRAGRPGSR
jgi:hypothetical protein